MGEWTVSTIKDHFEEMLRERDLRFQQRFQAQEQALAQAVTSSEKRLDGMNEFRKSLDDAQRTYVPRSEAMAAIERNEEDIKELRVQLANCVEKPWFEKQHQELMNRTHALEVGSSSDAGRREPIGDLIKWAAALGAGIILFLVGHFSFK